MEWNAFQRHVLSTHAAVSRTARPHLRVVGGDVKDGPTAFNGLGKRLVAGGGAKKRLVRVPRAVSESVPVVVVRAIVRQLTDSSSRWFVCQPYAIKCGCLILNVLS